MHITRRMAGSVAATAFIAAISSVAEMGVAQVSNDNGAAARWPLEITVTRPRLEAGLPGTAFTVLTTEDIAFSPAQTLPELLSLETGIQFRDLFGGTSGARASVDLRGFGAVATQNTLVLVNGRRLNDIDLAAVEFTNIPFESIERIEIVRGNSAAVLYGDGAVGGAINIITRPGAVFSREMTDAAVGSYGLAEGNFSAARTSLGWSAAVDVNALFADGYRENSALRQRGIIADVRRLVPRGEWFLRTTLDDQLLDLPGARRVTATTSQLAANPRGATTPNDYAAQMGHRTVMGLSRTLGSGGELVIDGGLRVKAQDSVVVSAFGPAFDTTTNTRLSTVSFTPRLRTASTIAGIDYGFSDYNQVARSGTGDVPLHRYDLKQHSVALYGQNTFSIRRGTDLTVGTRVQQVWFVGGDILDPSAVVTFDGVPFDGHRESESHGDSTWAAHLGLNHDLAGELVLFGRVGRSFRAPTVDERVLSSAGYNSFRLRTQTSWDAESGVGWRGDRLNAEASVWVMNVQDELHFNANTSLNENFDPIRRFGVEGSASVTLTDTWSLKVKATRIRARFREGTNKGKNVPLISPWAGSATLRWDTSDQFSVVGSISGTAAKWMDNDDANAGVRIPGSALVNFRIIGTYGLWRGSVQAINLLDKQYFNYAVASATTPTTYNAYPLGGRTMRFEVRREF